MIDKLIKKLWVVCLCLTSFSLIGCFHVPDEDWLPSKNKINTWNTQNDDVEKALNSFMDGIDMVSSQRNEMKNDEIKETNNEDEEITTDNPDEIIVEIKDEETDNENINWEEDNIQE